jgi:hypothetical protein
MTLTQIYDAIVSRIETLFPNHRRLSDPYDLENNPDNLLKQGWGLAAGPGGDNTERYVSCTESLSVNMTVPFTRAAFSRELDSSTKAAADKLLLEDMQVLADDVLKNNLNIQGPLINFVGFDGIDSVRADERRYVQIGCNITVENFKLLT